jgi:hypothetical protein
MAHAVTGRSPRRRWQALGALLLAAAAVCAHAGQKSASFIVGVDLLSDEKSTAQCERTVPRPGSKPLITVKCGPVRPDPRPDSRFHLNLYRSGELLGTVDGMMTTGTVTSWRVVHLVNRDYLEIMVGW